MSAAPPHILVVDDDGRLRDLLRRYLSENGFLVSTAADAAEARAKLESFSFDLLVLDVMMPGESGLDLTQDLRRADAQTGAVPILMLTAMAEAEDRIHGLERGADDYLTKPFEPRELLLRIRTILRRVNGAAPARAVGAPVLLGGLLFDAERLELRGPGRTVRLTEAEAALLRALAENPGATLTRDDLAQRLDLTGNPRTVDVQVTRLRRKIEPDPRFPRYLQTVRGKGYALLPD
ncbi:MULTISPECIES: response regulator [Oceanibaculum]|uniref:Transcriptional regulatory protein OmpR n=1 Tax=Oceanibaculum indicum P24 TaxID=1207063 RepID=K2JUI5_9PROT|nr:MULTISPECIES: response regulator transcription factor [Oceanibaculum]EKE68880.1 transcriptional regulatory protein OmpR [Oceanibaculum indicum P24]MCH2393454.1 response regulator transcription factor [Oceanibaculum sp.]